MKTYAERHGNYKIDWWRELDNPPMSGSKEHRVLITQSERWVTCAVGNQCDVIPRDRKGCPHDYKLHALGVAFDLYITNAEWKKARKTLLKIEKRSAKLIAEINKENED